METKNFAVLELDNDEAPMAGVLLNVTKDNLYEKLEKAVEEHFDGDVDIMDVPDMFTGSPYEDMTVNINDVGDTQVVITSYRIRILETWTY